MKIRVPVQSYLPEVIRAAGALLALAGGALIAFAVWVNVEASWYQSAQSREFEAMTAEPIVPPPIGLLARPPVPVQVSAAVPWLDPEVIGRLEIPRLDLRVIIREGISESTLRRAAGHLPGSAMPGQEGNFTVAGHRDTFFRPLRAITRQDEILVRTREKLFRYEVESVMVVQPEHTEVLQSGGEAVCTLVTCFPFDYVGPAPRRWIVRARLAGQD